MQKSPVNSEEQIKQRQQQIVEKARRGVLQFVKDKGGSAPMSEMHDFSLNKYLIQHQAFSQLMETLVDQGLVIFDHATFTATITDAGVKYISALGTL